MIKKLFVTFLAVLYLVVSSGATVHYQYCMGKLINVSLSHGHEDKCVTCGMDRKEKAYGKCCTDQHQQLKSDKSGSISHSAISLSTSVSLPVDEPFRIFHQNLIWLETAFPIREIPPPQTGVPAFIRNCVFRI